MNSAEMFQVDHPEVVDQYGKDNFLVVEDVSVPAGLCAIYFSSHDIYYPNSPEAFRSRIVVKDYYEWFGLRFPGARKHVYLRDVHKQWYLTGINDRVDTPEKVLSFLREVVGQCEVVTIGSSAGGYAAVLYGTALKARQVFSFNGQMEIGSLLNETTARENPLVFRFKDGALSRYFDLKPFLSDDVDVFYFYSVSSRWDAQQYRHVCDTRVFSIPFRTAHHGIPFLKCSLKDVFGLTRSELRALSGCVHRPFWFSVRRTGLLRVFLFCIDLFFKIALRRLDRIWVRK